MYRPPDLIQSVCTYFNLSLELCADGTNAVCPFFCTEQGTLFPEAICTLHTFPAVHAWANPPFEYTFLQKLADAITKRKQFRMPTTILLLIPLQFYTLFTPLLPIIVATWLPGKLRFQMLHKQFSQGIPCPMILLLLEFGQAKHTNSLHNFYFRRLKSCITRHEGTLHRLPRRWIPKQNTWISPTTKSITTLTLTHRCYSPVRLRKTTVMYSTLSSPPQLKKHRDQLKCKTILVKLPPGLLIDENIGVQPIDKFKSREQQLLEQGIGVACPVPQGWKIYSKIFSTFVELWRSSIWWKTAMNSSGSKLFKAVFHHTLINVEHFVSQILHGDRRLLWLP